MGVPENHPAIVAARQRGLIPSESPELERKPKRERPELAGTWHEVFTTTWQIGVEVPSLANSREWRLRNRVAQSHRKAVSWSLGSALYDLAPLATRYHLGGKVRVTLTRLGGRALDRHDNLPAALKYVLDAVCLMIGADDADPRLLVAHAQEPGGGYGVRIEITEG